MAFSVRAASGRVLRVGRMTMEGALFPAPKIEGTIASAASMVSASAFHLQYQ